MGGESDQPTDAEFVNPTVDITPVLGNRFRMTLRRTLCLKIDSKESTH